MKKSKNIPKLMLLLCFNLFQKQTKSLWLCIDDIDWMQFIEKEKKEKTKTKKKKEKKNISGFFI